MYDVRPNLIIGFHGCDQTVCDSLLNNPDRIKMSREPFDWLGHGMYFWENNYERALSWATAKQQRGKIAKPAVIGAVINLDYCCDFLGTKHTELLERHYFTMRKFYTEFGIQMPQNKDSSADEHKDKLLRDLDCAVIESMHNEIGKQVQKDILSKGFSDHTFFDSVRGVFVEGGPAFEGSGIMKKSHIQICIRNSNCIKGFFLPRRKINWPKEQYEYISDTVSAS